MEPVNLFEMEALARERLGPDTWAPIAGGAADELSLRRNREAFDAILLRNRIFRDVSVRDQTTTVLGRPISFPVMAAPTGGQTRGHPDGELAVARAANSVGTAMAVAMGGNYTYAELAAASSGPLWCQFYHRDDEVTEYVVTAAAEAGFDAVCVTAARQGLHMMNSAAAQIGAVPRFVGLANLRDNPRLRDKLAAVDYARFPALTWSRLEWLKGLTGLPLVVKEVLTPDDAKRCVDHGADAIVVSNHGARSMDTTQATIEALPPIVEAVGGQVEIYLDSGVRRGADVFKALALGARAVLVGRPLFWGLAVDGEAGVRRMFEILRTEMDAVMAFAGCNSLDEIERSLVITP